ncbi:MAG: 4-(cytidine 5'-diphospho)-2-C-methyl-D-erythritol kinase [Pirellulales bacterium]|nr:4-(cytidine 5'-diphospho)-2-C-methyl-D-erythritol kinase [Pirellulales bacterium]
MYVREWSEGVEVSAPAKLNLFLEVLGRRSDGYHELETLLVPIALFDTLRVHDDAHGQISLTCEFAVGYRAEAQLETEDFPEGTDNSAVKAVWLLRERAGLRRGIRIHLVKRIPSAAGLAGGSSDAAAALVAADRLWRLGLPRTELLQFAAEVGSDVPFFLGDGPAMCRGRGERIEPLELAANLHFVVVRPPVGLSTADVFRVCRPAEQARDAAPLVDALRRGKVESAGRLFHNRLQPAAESLSPWIRRLNAAFAGLDVLGHQMSGSGSSYFGLVRHARQAQHVAARLRARGLGQVYAVRACR